MPKAELDVKRSVFDYLLFFLPKKPRPDFTKEPIRMQEYFWHDDFRGNMYTEEPIFSNISPIIALKNNWFHNVEEYQIIASLEFARRFPAHAYSKEFTKMYGYTKKNMLAYITGRKLLRVIRKRSATRVHVEK